MVPIIMVLFIVGLFAIMLSLTPEQAPSDIRPLESDPGMVTVFKSPTCGCCGNYVGFLEDAGFAVDVRMVDDMDTVKDHYGIPGNLESCHTAVFYGKHIVEGHVPIDVVNGFIMEPYGEQDGISLPGMPAGSPGMGDISEKTGTWTIYGFKDGDVSVYSTY